MRSGDTVKHKPSGETWTVAYVFAHWLSWYGWPEGEAKLEDCELVKACTDEEHEASLREWAGKPMADSRARTCKWQLDQLLNLRRRNELRSIFGLEGL